MNKYTLSIKDLSSKEMQYNTQQKRMPLPEYGRSIQNMEMCIRDSGTTDVPAGKGGYLINLNLSTLNNGQGILVDTDPTIPEGVTPEPGGQEDLEDENVNVIVRVQVQAWTAVNVFPIL